MSSGKKNYFFLSPLFIGALPEWDFFEIKGDTLFKRGI